MYYLYDVAGRMVTELSSSGSWHRGEIYAAGKHIATYIGGNTYFSHVNWLGTERARTNAGGALAETCTGLPFGDDANCTVGGVSPLYFTGKQRDTETGLDYFGARYYTSSLGRFMTPDEPFVDQSTRDPQSWNLYSYVRNNPLRAFDPTGNACVSTDGGASFHDESGGGQTCAESYSRSE